MKECLINPYIIAAVWMAIGYFYTVVCLCMKGVNDTIDNIMEAAHINSKYRVTFDIILLIIGALFGIVFPVTDFFKYIIFKIKSK